MHAAFVHACTKCSSVNIRGLARVFYHVVRIVASYFRGLNYTSVRYAAIINVNFTTCMPKLPKLSFI